MPCPTPTPGGGSISTNAYWELCGASLMGGDYLFTQNNKSSGNQSNQTNCPVGEPTVKVDNVSVVNQGSDLYGATILYVINGTLTNPTSSDVHIREIAFYHGNFNPNLAPQDGGTWYPPNSGFIVITDNSNVELANKSSIIKAKSSETFKTKYQMLWDTHQNGQYPTAFIPTLKYPETDTARPTNHWTWASIEDGTMPGTCDPNYYH